MMKITKQTGISHSLWPLLTLFNIIVFQFDQPALLEPRGLLNRFTIEFWLSEPSVVCHRWTFVTGVTQQWLTIKVSTLPAVWKHLALLSTRMTSSKINWKLCLFDFLNQERFTGNQGTLWCWQSRLGERYQTWSSIHVWWSWFYRHVFGCSCRI